MSLLFDAPLIDGLRYADEVIDAREEQSLIGHLEASDLAPFRFHGWLGNRKTMSFGWRYDFDDASFAATTPLPGWLLPLRDQAAAFARLAPDDLVQALVTRYEGLDEARALGVELRLGSLVEPLYTKAAETGHAEEDFAAVIRALE